MKRLLLTTFLALGTIVIWAQGLLPNHPTTSENWLVENGLFEFKTSSFANPSPPPFPVRTMAEWEEIEYLTVTWTAYRPTLAEIIRNAKDECKVIVICTDSTQVQSQLLNQYNFTDLNNILYLEAAYNSIWIRDYGANTIYANDVDSLMLVDWIYNRPRPADDVIPGKIADMLGLELYSTSEAPYEMVHTGGNFTSDGMGTAFSSRLILDENAPGNPYGTAPLTESEIDQFMNEFMGISRYIKMETLPFDVIHHIDMHMRLLDEETILVGQYPDGVADGPQIEANIQYLQDNFLSVFGTPYEFVRIQMPPDNGAYPDTWWADYRTYTNSVLVNKTILVPVYEEEFDTTALRVYEEAMPGYNVVGIDCNDIIESLGALHCITRAVGVQDPLWIVHDPLENKVNPPADDFEVVATMKHRSGIASATLYYTDDLTAGFTSVEMTPIAGTDDWVADIPFAQVDQYYYYVEGNAVSGKTQVRPLPAPEGYWEFKLEFTSTNVAEAQILPVTELMPVYPNPASAITVVPVQSNLAQQGQIRLVDILGRTVEVIFEGTLQEGLQNFYLDAARYASGTYLVELQLETGRDVQSLVIR